MARIRISRLFIEFIESEKAGGLVLVFCTVASILISNSAFGAYYAGLWQRSLDLSLPGIDLKYNIARWLNDGLMAVSFSLWVLRLRERYMGVSFPG
jgi:NhaA family Na+:H+ antiporter